MNYKDENILIEAIKKGEESAFVYALKTYNKPLYAYALTLAKDEALAKDILQNVFLKTWEGRTKLHINKSLQNYLFKSVYNEFINQYKKNKSLLLLEQKYYDALDKVVNEDENSFTEKTIKFITSEIQNLPPKCKEVFLLSREEGLTNIEIASYLNISVKSVEAHIHKGFSLLRKRIGDKVDSFLFLLFGKFESPLLRKKNF
jgi:RNA polymerase sigma-70 factor (ECF subfamily)